MIYDVIPRHLLVSDDYYIAFLSFTSRLILEWINVAGCEVINTELRDQTAINIGSDILRLNRYRSSINELLDDAADEDLYQDQVWYLSGAWKHIDMVVWSNKLGIDFIEDDYTNIGNVSSTTMRNLIYDKTALKGLEIIGYMP